jgi:transcriptional regulator with XRE-family HTH domain
MRTKRRRGRPPIFIPSLHLGKRIHCLRLAAKLNQIDLARMLECSQSTISKIESGELEPTAYQLYQMRKSFEVSIDSIMDDKIDFVTVAHNHNHFDFSFDKVCGKLGLNPDGSPVKPPHK